ncbi:flagellar biosynthetic protein FliR [Vibrio barjaei]|uniref:flagellar biosynthetic protein FliR n=1 Tax=Vibrio barjaei TaxID=1676683 RepID=UPI002284C6AC|nr:flagellar biosynthetic protein FliR [Vibrio barjaei]MCY9872325.1 flagellar biosynthetic protein FliR [Vibrio barjaei]
MTLDYNQVIVLMGHIWWPSVRLTGFFIIAPLFSDRSAPVKLRILLVMVLSFIAASLIRHDEATIIRASNEILLTTFKELLIGAAIGLLFNFLRVTFTQAGQIISMQMGLSMAVMNDPVNGDSASLISKLYGLVFILLFLSFDGHIIAVQTLFQSYHHFPLTTYFSTNDILHIVKTLSWCFSMSLVIAIPSIGLMLLSSFTFGVLSKVAPSLNIFALGFPMTIVIGILSIAINMINFGELFLMSSEQIDEIIIQLLGE